MSKSEYKSIKEGVDMDKYSFFLENIQPEENNWIEKDELEKKITSNKNYWENLNDILDQFEKDKNPLEQDEIALNSE